MKILLLILVSYSLAFTQTETKREWHADGQKQLEVNYVNGKKHGKSIEWVRMVRKYMR